MPMNQATDTGGSAKYGSLPAKSGDKEIVGRQQNGDNPEINYNPYTVNGKAKYMDDNKKSSNINNTEFFSPSPVANGTTKVSATSNVKGLLDSTKVKKTTKTYKIKAYKYNTEKYTDKNGKVKKKKVKVAYEKTGKATTTKVTHKSNDIYGSKFFKNILESNNIRKPSGIKLYDKTYRFGVMNPYTALSTGREFLFFTKPDLNVFGYSFLSNGTESIYTNKLNSSLENIPFWMDLFEHRKKTLIMLQNSYPVEKYELDPFNHLLQNQCTSNLEVQSLSSEMIETPQNMYGVGYSYRGSSESSDDNPTFSLEFKDSKYLDVYLYFKAYEEYETLKHHGFVSPRRQYMFNKIVHDQIAIFKFIVDEDMETIIYYGKMYGVVPVSLPRDVFGNPNFENGISYNIEFKAAFYEDMNPNIISDFNNLSYKQFSNAKHSIPIYNTELDRVDGRGATCAYVDIDTTSATAKKSPGGQVLKLIWKGDN